jgi:hypothetical protein
VIDFFSGNFMSQPAQMNVRAWSPGFSASVMHNLPLGQSNFAIAAGYGFSSFNVHLNGNFVRAEGSGPVTFHQLPAQIDYRKHKITANYVEVPVELRFRTRGLTPFKCGLGFTAGYAVSSHTKTVDANAKTKVYRIEGLSDFRFGLTGRMGFGRFAVFSAYYLNSFVEGSTLGGMRAFTLGLTIQMI